MRAMQGEIKVIQKKHAGDIKALGEAQQELYKRYNLNPLAGCIPQIIQLVLLILFYQALIKFVNVPEVNSYFLGLDLTCSRKVMTQVLGGTAEAGVSCQGVQATWVYWVVPVLAVITQFIMSVMISPGAQVRDIEPNNSKKKSLQIANEKEEDTAAMAANMQKQMMFLMPFMTGFIALSMPQGVGIYWIVSTIFSIVQQWVISGPGGLTSYFKNLKTKLKLDKLARS
jgi:YidC/Oxa1 family membrane protein insertase